MSLETFNEQVLPLKDKLYRYSLRIVKDQQEAEDVVQDIMIKVWNKRDQWKDWSSIEAMCMTMTRNLSIDRTRSKHRHTDSMPDHYDVPAVDQSPAQKAVTSDMVNYIQQIIDQLPEKQKSIIQLREIEGYTYKEIAEMLEISISQVKISVHRARLFLKKALLKNRQI